MGKGVEGRVTLAASATGFLVGGTPFFEVLAAARRVLSLLFLSFDFLSVWNDDGWCNGECAES